MGTAQRNKGLAVGLVVMVIAALGLAFVGGAGAQDAGDVYVSPSSTVAPTTDSVPTEVDTSAADRAQNNSNASEVAGATDTRASALAFTGQDAALTALIGAGAIAIGVVIIVARRRTADAA